MRDAFAHASALALVLVLAGCATTEQPAPARRLTADEGRALVARLLPDGTSDRNGWATDIYAGIAALDVAPTVDNICAVIAIAQQESGLRADPAVPGLAAIAWREIERQREQMGIPKLVLDAALDISSPTGKTYRQRIDAVHTEREMSDIFDDFIGMVPLAKRFLGDRNPVHTGGPMQVSVAFAEAHAGEKPYPYPVTGSIRHEVFTRRGGVYFGIAHLLEYPASYDRYVYRFADYNAGWYSSRNAGFQNAVTQLSGVPLARDGDLLRYENGKPAAEASSTELAVRVIARRIGVSDSDIRRDLVRGKTSEFERTPVYTEVFAAADRNAGKSLQRAMVPDIQLKGPKITRNLTTEWYARNVERRFDACRARYRA
jgi:hypothetical protein